MRMHSVVIDGSCSSAMVSRSRSAKLRSAATASSRPLTNICGTSAGRALLVDDDEVVRRSVRQALEPIGWKVTEAENGQVAVEAIAVARPDVIILHLIILKIDAFEFRDVLRRRSD